MFANWAPYALVGAGALGIWLMQNAFNAGPLQESLPAISAGEPLVGILLGAVIGAMAIIIVVARDEQEKVTAPARYAKQQPKRPA